MAIKEMRLVSYDKRLYDVRLSIETENHRDFEIEEIKDYDSFEVVEIDSPTWKAMLKLITDSRNKKLDELDGYHKRINQRENK